MRRGPGRCACPGVCPGKRAEAIHQRRGAQYCRQRLSSPQCEIFVGLVAGAANRVPAEAMAYGHRDAKFVMYERLKQIKRKYDPENIFRNNQNIKG